MTFEQFVQHSPDYTNLRFQYGNLLFVKEYGEYKIQVVRLAFEVWQYQQERIDQLKTELAQEVEGLERFIEEDCVHDFDVLKGAVLHACNRLKAI